MDQPLAPPSFSCRDPAQAEFWSERYAKDFLPWDQHEVPAPLRRALTQDPATSGIPGSPARVLIPGCGSGYELECLAGAGYDALAIDISPPAIARARGLVGTYAERVQLADCFALATDPDHRGGYDWIYERAFCCALPPRLWATWGEAMAALVAPGGVLAGVFHVDPDPELAIQAKRRGPPFAIRAGELALLLEPNFVCIDDCSVPHEESIPVFRGKERWMVWRRRTAPNGGQTRPQSA